MKKDIKDIEKILNSIFNKIFSNSHKSYENFSERKESSWDSLKGVSLLLEIESKFSIKISPNQLEKFNSFKNIKKILNRELNEK